MESLPQRRVATQRQRQAVKVLAERPVIAKRAGGELPKVSVPARQFVEGCLRQIGMAAQPFFEAPHTGGVKRSAIPAVELSYVLHSEILKHKARAHVEGRLAQVRDEQVGFGGVGNDQGEPLARSLEIERALVVPGSQQSKHFARERVREKPVRLIDRPHEALLHGLEHVALHEPVKIHAGAAPRTPASAHVDLQPQLVGEGLRQGNQHRIHGLKLRCIQLLKVGHRCPSLPSAGAVEHARQERRLACLAGAFRRTTLSPPSTAR